MNAEVGRPQSVDPVELERQSWIATAMRCGATFFGEHLAEDAVVVLPGDVLTKDAVLAALATSEPWEEFHFSDERLLQPATNVQILVYRARAKRAAQPVYDVSITSVYVADDDRTWRLVCHQQTTPPRRHT